VLDQNFLSGADRYGDGVDSEMDGFVALCAVLGKLERVSNNAFWTRTSPETQLTLASSFCRLSAKIWYRRTPRAAG